MQAYEKEREKLGKQSSQCDKMYGRIQDEMNKLEDSYQQGLKCYEENLKAIERHFAEVRRLVQVEEDHLREKSKDLFTSFEIKNKEREFAYLSNLEVLDEYAQEASKSTQLSPEEFLGRTATRDALTLRLCDNYDSVAAFSGAAISKNTVLDCLVKAFEKSKTKELKESNTRETIKADLSKAKVLGDKPKKPCLVKENPSMKYAPSKKYAKKDKEPLKEAVVAREVREVREPRDVPVLVKRPQTSFEKPIPNEISGFEENNALFKSFLSSNASFFIERRYVYVLGGFCEESNSIIRFNLDSSKWEPVAPMLNRSKFGVAHLNKEIVVLGGKRDKLRIAGGESYRDNELCGSWGLDKPRSGFGTAVFNEELYVVGGNDGEEILTTFERYSQYEGAWKRLECLNERRDELAVTVGRDSRIYAIGGFGGCDNTCLRSVERYDPVTRKWEFTRPMNTSRRALSAVTLADGIYAIGGFDGMSYLRSVEKYD